MSPTAERQTDRKTDTEQEAPCRGGLVASMATLPAAARRMHFFSCGHVFFLLFLRRLAVRRGRPRGQRQRRVFFRHFTMHFTTWCGATCYFKAGYIYTSSSPSDVRAC